MTVAHHQINVTFLARERRTNTPSGNPRYFCHVRDRHGAVRTFTTKADSDKVIEQLRALRPYARVLVTITDGGVVTDIQHQQDRQSNTMFDQYY